MICSETEVRNALVSHLQADSALLAICPRIYPSRTPASLVWPFIKIGVVTDLPLRISGAYGSQELIGTIHVFTKEDRESGKYDPEAECAAIKKRVAAIVDSAVLLIPGGYVNFRYDGGQILIDGDESSAYHAIVKYVGSCIVD